MTKFQNMWNEIFCESSCFIKFCGVIFYQYLLINNSLHFIIIIFLFIFLLFKFVLKLELKWCVKELLFFFNELLNKQDDLVDVADLVLGV